MKDYGLRGFHKSTLDLVRVIENEPVNFAYDTRAFESLDRLQKPIVMETYGRNTRLSIIDAKMLLNALRELGKCACHDSEGDMYGRRRHNLRNIIWQAQVGRGKLAAALPWRSWG